MSLLATRGISKRYGSRQVVDGVSLSVKTGEVAGLQDEIQALDTENKRLSDSVADLNSRLEDMAKNQSARAQAAVVQVRTSIVAAGNWRILSGRARKMVAAIGTR